MGKRKHRKAVWGTVPNMAKELSETEKKLLRWEEDDFDSGDLIHRHFEECIATIGDWGDVADTGRRLNNLMFEDDVEVESPSHHIYLGIAAAAYYLAIAQVAKQLGVSSDAVTVALETDRLGQPDEFVAECKSHVEEPT